MEEVVETKVKRGRKPNTEISEKVVRKVTLSDAAIAKIEGLINTDKIQWNDFISELILSASDTQIEKAEHKANLLNSIRELKNDKKVINEILAILNDFEKPTELEQ